MTRPFRGFVQAKLDETWAHGKQSEQRQIEESPRLLKVLQDRLKSAGRTRAATAWGRTRASPTAHRGSSHSRTVRAVMEKKTQRAASPTPSR